MTVYVNPLLDEGDLERLTGTRQGAAQARWLKRNRIPYTVDRLGKPKTTWGLVEKALQGEDDKYTPPQAA